MDAIAVMAGLAACIAFWSLLTKSMKINGMPWWWRHLSAALWSPLALLGGSMLVGSLLGLTDTEGEPLGVAGALSGIAVLTPLLLPLWISWRAAKRKLSKPHVAEPQQEPEPKLEPDPEPKSEPDEQTPDLELARESAPEPTPEPEPALEPDE